MSTWTRPDFTKPAPAPTPAERRAQAIKKVHRTGSELVSISWLWLVLGVIGGISVGSFALVLSVVITAIVINGLGHFLRAWALCQEDES